MFGTSGIRGRVGETVTASLALAVGRALGADTDQVVIGRDPRESGTILADAVAAGLRESGTDVVKLGLVATPTIARSVAWCEADAGVAITASHNPPEDNGLKLWQPSGQAFDEGRRTTLVNRIENESFALQPWDGLGEKRRWPDAQDRHVEAILDSVSHASLSVVVDIGNGAGGLTTTVLDKIGCTVRTLNAQPDGRFPGRPSEPTADHCADLRAFVAESDADLGIALDGDADRMLAVTGDGDWVSGDDLLAIFARSVATTGDRIAVPVDTSLVVDDTLEASGASVTRTRVGDVYVAERATSPDVVFGGEPSGAWIWPDETLCPDGPLAAAKLVELLSGAQSLAALVDELPTYPIRRANIETDQKAVVMDRVEAQVTATYPDRETFDGVWVKLEDGWFLIRQSGTQSLIRVTAEARTTERAEELFERAQAVVHEAIDSVNRG